MYRERTTGEIKSQSLWKKDFNNISLPKVWKEATLDALNIDEILPSTPPETTSMQIAQVDGAVQNDDGDWVENWVVVDRFSDLHDEDGNVVQTKAEREAEYIESENSFIATDNRLKRNQLLADSDWTQMNDSPLSNEDKTLWATYRQELRGVTDLDAWPNLADDDWPVAP